MSNVAESLQVVNRLLADYRALDHAKHLLETLQTAERNLTELGNREKQLRQSVEELQQKQVAAQRELEVSEQKARGVTREAESRSQQLLDDANKEAENLKISAQKAADKMLGDAHKNLQKLREVETELKNSVGRLEAQARKAQDTLDSIRSHVRDI